MRVLVPRGAPVLYRIYDELGLLGRHLGLEPGHSFYTVESSLLAKEASQMHGGSRDAPLARHYAIYTSDRCVDIVSTQKSRFVLLREFPSGHYNSERPDVKGE